jgi:hypothetical protein
MIRALALLAAGAALAAAQNAPACGTLCVSAKIREHSALAPACGDTDYQCASLQRRSPSKI